MEGRIFVQGLFAQGALLLECRILLLDFGAQKAPKIEPKRLPKPFKNQLKIRVKLNVDFDRNLAQLGGQLGLNLGAQVEHFWRTFANLKGYPFRDPNMTPK